MRIGIDVRYLSHGLVGGVRTYVAQFVPALIELATSHQIYLYADTKRPFELSALPDHVTVRYLKWQNPISSVYNDLFSWRQIAEDHLDVVHFPANYGFGPADARTVITVHDALNILPLPQLMRGLANGHHQRTPRLVAMTVYLHLCTRIAMRKAQLLFTVSGHAQREIARYSGFDLARILPVPHAPSSDLRRIEDTTILTDVRRRHGLSEQFVLADALKNPGAVVEAWRLLAPEVRGTRRIVFFSRRSDPLPVVREAEAAGLAHVLIRPSREDLIALYSMAEAFIFPSWIEGFGIPILEAMTCGAPVIASDRGAIPEVAGDAALLADAQDTITLARHLATVLQRPDEAERLRRRGFVRASQFSWQSTARQILEGYERAMSEKRTSVHANVR